MEMPQRNISDLYELRERYCRFSGWKNQGDIAAAPTLIQSAWFND